MKRCLIEICAKWWNAEAHYAFNLGLALRDSGYDVFFVVNEGSSPAEKIEEAGFDKIELPQKGSYSLLKNYLKRVAPDYVYCFKSKFHWFFAFFRFFYFFSPFSFSLIRVRACPEKPRKGPGNVLLYSSRFTDVLISVNRSISDSLKKFRKDQSVDSVIYFGSPPLKRTMERDRGKVLSDLNFPSRAKIFCVLGRNQKIKGHSELMDALQNLAIPDEVFFLFLIKNLDEFKEETTTLRQLKKNFPEAKIRIEGWKNNPGEILSACHFGLITSQGSEAICRVAVEFFSLGIPVAATPIGALPEMIEDGKNGLLFDGIKSGDIKEGLKRCFGLTDSEYQTLKTNAFKSHEEKYSMEVFRQNHQKLIRRIKIGPKNPHRS